MSGRADVFGIDGYTMEAPVVSHKIIGFSSPKRDVKKREYIYDLEKKAEGFVPSTKYTPSDPNGFLTDPKKIKFA
jgi:hypothetical protein